MTFDPATEGPQLTNALSLYQFQLKGVSFLPRLQMGAYPQMPYERITKEQYDTLFKKLSPLRLHGHKKESSGNQNNEVPDKFCDAAGCAFATTEHQKDTL